MSVFIAQTSWAWVCYRCNTRPATARASLDGTETFTIHIDDNLQARQEVQVTAQKVDGGSVDFTVDCRVDTPVEVDYYRNGSILHTVLRRMANDA